MPRLGPAPRKRRLPHSQAGPCSRLRLARGAEIFVLELQTVVSLPWAQATGKPVDGVEDKREMLKVACSAEETPCGVLCRRPAWPSADCFPPTSIALL